jgi:hypothetical protein
MPHEASGAEAKADPDKILLKRMEYYRDSKPGLTSRFGRRFVQDRGMPITDGFLGKLRFFLKAAYDGRWPAGLTCDSGAVQWVDD